MDSEPLVVSKEFHDILDEWENSSDHYFLTGKAGTGKSTLLKLFRNTTAKNLAVLAPTGMAAIQVKGQTLHSFFKLAPHLLLPRDIRKPKNARLLQKLDAIVIDEISMVRADLMDAVDRSLRLARGNDIPFGGVQMILFGDVFQLPPVVSSKEEKSWFDVNYPSPYFFDAHCLQGADIHTIELHRVYRQEDAHFIQLLDCIRHGEVTETVLEELNAGAKTEFRQDDVYITLCSHNYQADAINRKRMLDLPGEARIFTAVLSGQVPIKQIPVETVLTLKKETQVMFVKNDLQQRYVNGTLGTVKDFTEDGVIVEINAEHDKRKRIEVTPADWEIIKYSLDPNDSGKLGHEVVGNFQQLPLKAAWAITIHKSQGQSYDKVTIDLGRGAFEYGQTYVALSRCRTLQGIRLTRPLDPLDIMVDPRIIDFFESRRWQ